MDPLQHLVAPRRPLPSSRATARDGASRNVFALPVIHQFGPVLAASPKSYMASDVKKRGDAKVKDEGGNVLESTMVPSQPQRPKSKEGVESPRVLRPQPPAGISSRTDVDIYRYSQGAEQRMAIRPLFEQRRDSSGETRSASAKRKGKRAVKKGEVETGARVDAEDGGDADALKKPESEDDKRTVLEDDENEQQGGVSNQDNVRASSPTCDDCLGASIADQDLIEIVEDKTSDFDEESRTTAVENVGPTLLKKLDASSYHEPFLQTDGPKLSWLREVIETASPAPTTVANPNLNRQCGQNRDVVVYKTLAKDMRTLGGKSVLVTVLLNSRGAVQITCICNGSTDKNIVDFSESDLEQSLLLRPDLQVRTPKWAEWIITKVRCDSRMIFFVDFADAEESEKRVCFLESIHIGGNDIAVEMIALPSASSLLISVRDATSRVKQADILLRLEDLRRLAISLGKISSVENTDQEVTALLGDHEFLSQLATKSNVINVGMSCTGFTNELKPSLRSNGCPAKSTDMTADVPANMNLLKRVELLDPPNYVQDLLEENKLIGTVALLVQAYVENGVLSALRHFQQQEAVQLNVAAFMQQAAGIDSESAFDERVERNLEAARMSKLRDIAIASILDDMVLDFIAFECRVEIHAAKYSGGYDDHYASKVQATYRMSAQKKSYDHKRHVRVRAAQMLQALQRGIIARRRYSEMKAERERYLFYGFRSSLYHATANMKDPRQRAHELSSEAEQRRHAFLMQVIQGYVAENFVDEEFRVSAQLVRDIYNEYGVVVGCSTSLGDVVVSYLGAAPDQAVYAHVGESTHSSDSIRLFSNSQVSAALLLGLRDQYDDTFGLSSSARQASTIKRSKRKNLKADDSAPPRWMLKTCLSFQQSNLDRVAGLRLTRKAAGRKSAHLVARDYRCVLASSFNCFDKCRATWEADIQTRQEQQRMLDAFSINELAQHCLDLLISCVKDWGIDPDPLFGALNLCGRHCHGKAAIRIMEQKFNAYASNMNEVHGKQSVFSLRKEISQELEDFEKLLALRILNMAVDDAVTVPTSELLHIMLKGNLDEEYIRHGLSTVLPIASITEKHELSRKMLFAYANASYGDAFNLICWSCLDVAENVTVEAARFLDRITRPTTDNGDAYATATLFCSKATVHQHPKKPTGRSSESLAARALYLLTGSQAVRFLQFLAKVAHFNKAIQKRVLAHLAPYADKYEMHRLASAICSLDDFSIVSQIFDDCFATSTLQSCTAVWIQYTTLYGEEKSTAARNTTIIQPEPTST